MTLTSPTTVNEARALPHDSWVILVGNIVNALPGGKYYSFRDSSGEIVIEIDQNVWRGLYVGESDQVEINGEIIANRSPATFVVRAIRKF